MKKKLYFAFLIFSGMLISCNKDIEITKYEINR